MNVAAKMDFTAGDNLGLCFDSCAVITSGEKSDSSSFFLPLLYFPSICERLDGGTERRQAKRPDEEKETYRSEPAL